MRAEELEKRLCEAFCGAISVRPVPIGYAVSSAFKDNSGDPLVFYLTESQDGVTIEDDGSYLASLIARDIPIDEGKSRAHFLEAILAQANAFWDRETFEIKTPAFLEAEIPDRAIEFLSALLRVRDLELITREVVRSTFKEDALEAITKAFGDVATFEEGAEIDRDFAEYPADIIIKPKVQNAIPGALYLVNTNERLNEALLLQTEAQLNNRHDFVVIALIEEPDMRQLSRKKFQRAQNRSLTMPIFRGDEEAAMRMIGSKLNFRRAA